MKIRSFITVLVAIISISNCKCQNDNQVSSINFFNYIKNLKYIDTYTKSIKEKNDVVLIYYEFDVKDLGIGKACLYAISKEYPEQWSVEAIHSPKGNCDVEGNYTRIFYLNCAARNLFSLEKERLIDEFDIYVFFINKEDLDGPLYEASESGSIEYYNEKPENDIIIYKFLDGSWRKIGNQKLGKYTPRTFGSNYMEDIARSRE